MSDSTAALYAALARAQGKFKPIAKNREVMITMKSGGKYKFRYADIDEINTATREALTGEGLAIIQPVMSDPATNVHWIETTLVHSDGGSIKSRIDLKSPSTFGDYKEFGAASSYLRRYAISALLGVAADDDLDQNGRGVGDEEGNSVEDEASRIGALVDKLLSDVSKTKSDADVMALWKANNVNLSKFPNAFNEVKASIAKHRRALADAATAGSPQ